MSQILALLSRDGVNVATLQRLYDVYRDHPGFAAEAAAAGRMLDEDTAWRAYWLLLHCARDHRLSSADAGKIAAHADEARHWISRLALCQLFAAAGPPPPAARPALFSFLSECFRDRRVIIRAWAITALATFKEDPEFRGELEALIALARAEPGNAMQGRLRKIGLAPRIPVRRKARPSRGGSRLPRGEFDGRADRRDR